MSELEGKIKDFFENFKNTFIINTDANENSDDNYYISRFIIIVMFVIIAFILLVCVIEIYQLTEFIFYYDFNYNYSNMFKHVCGKEFLEFETPRFQITKNILNLKIINDNGKNYNFALQIIKFFICLIAVLFINRCYSILLFRDIDIKKSNILVFVLIYTIFILSILILPIYIFLIYLYNSDKALSISKNYNKVPIYVFILVVIIKIFYFSPDKDSDNSQLAYFCAFIIIYLLIFYILYIIISKIDKDRIIEDANKNKDNEDNKELVQFNDLYNKFNNDNNILKSSILNNFAKDIFGISDSDIYMIYYSLFIILIISILSYLYFTKVNFSNFSTIMLKQYIILPILLLIVIIFIVKFSQIFNTYINNYILFLPYKIYKIYLKELNDKFRFILDNENNIKDDVVFKKDNNIKINVANSILMILYNGIFEANLIYENSNPINSEYINIIPEFNYYSKSELDGVKIIYKDDEKYNIDYYLNNKNLKKNIFYNFNDCYVINNDVLFAIMKNTSISTDDVIIKDIEDNYVFKCVNDGSKIEDKGIKIFSCLYKEYHKYHNANVIVSKFEKYFDISNVTFENIAKYINIAIDNVNKNKTYNNASNELKTENIDASEINRYNINNIYGLNGMKNMQYNDNMNLDLFINKYKNFLIINFLDMENLRNMTKRANLYDNETVMNNYLHYKNYIDDLSSNLKIFFDYVNMLLIDNSVNTQKKVSNNIISNYNNTIRKNVEDIYIDNNLKREIIHKPAESNFDFDEKNRYIKLIIKTINTNIDIIEDNLSKINKNDTDNKQLNRFLLEFKTKNIEEYILTVKKESFFDIENIESYNIITYLDTDNFTINIQEYANENNIAIDTETKSGYVIIQLYYAFLHYIISKMIDINNRKINKKIVMSKTEDANIKTNLEDISKRLNEFKECNDNIFSNLDAKRIIKGFESEILVDYEDKNMQISNANIKKIKEVDRLIYLLIFIYIIVFIIIYIVYRILISLYYITKIKLDKDL
jgi:hypothetical protein